MAPPPPRRAGDVHGRFRDVDDLLIQPNPASRFTIGKRAYLMIDDDPGHARERVVAGLDRKYGAMRGIEDAPVCGTPAEVTDGLRAVIDAWRK